jgi:phage terminase large subunit-like protein
MSSLPPKIEVQLQRDMAELHRRKSQKFAAYFPDCQKECDPKSPFQEDHVGLCRALYKPHIQFMDAGAEHHERLFLAANQIGKTECAGYEMTAHLTGKYPHWWKGRRFTKPVEAWLAGDTMLSTRNVLQVAMMGKVEGVETRTWTGMIPAELVVSITRKSGGVALCIDKVWVQHVSGGTSTMEFLSYDQGRKVFQGTGRDVIWLDEEPPDPPLARGEGGSEESNDIYTECLLRTITRDGLVLATFTPLRGLTPFVDGYLKSAVMPDSEGEVRNASDVVFGRGKEE